LRLQAARHALDLPGAQIADVAITNGFVDQAHFTRLFKKRFGTTPGTIARSRSR
jgi:transcriptional regulator GlxA family with amidase domain